MDQKKIGKFLKTLRNEKGITQEQLAAHFNTTSRSVSRWETGSNLPDISLLVEIADFYDVDVREIIDGERKKDMMDHEVREVANKMASYAGNEKDNLLGPIQITGVLGVLIAIGAIILQVVGYEPEWHRFLAIVVSAVAMVMMAVITLYVTGLLKKITKNKALVKVIAIVTIVLTGITTVAVLFFSLIVFALMYDSWFTKPVVMTEASTYNEVMSHDYNIKYYIPDEDMMTVLPASVDPEAVTEFQYTYWHPWDSEYVLYMTVEYDDASYEAEMERLTALGIDENYTQYYSVTGEPSGYDLVAIDADERVGFAYAMIPEGSSEANRSITYVLLYYYHYQIEMDYSKYIPGEYLLQGFDATKDSPYRQEVMETLSND